jgi:uncharacterized protein (TIGR01244 family)
MKFPWILTLFVVALCPLRVGGQILEPLPTAVEEAPLIALSGGSLPEPGLLAAGQPSAEQLGEVAKAGYRTILDLRAPTEDRGYDEPARARELGLVYHNLPIVPAQLDRATLDRFRELLKTAERPILLHCGTANRVGGVLYAHWVLDQGLAPEAALERAKAAGLKSHDLAEKVRALVAETP